MREVAETKTGSKLGLGTFAALKYPDFRLLWGAQLGSAMAVQAELIARSWLVLELTGSAAAVGLVHTTRAIGQLGIVPIAGVIADRIDRRYLLIAADSANAVSFLLLGFLIATDHVHVWHVIASAIVAGAAMSVSQTSGQAIIPSLVPREGLMNAVSLSSVLMGSSRVLGPSLAGFMMEVFGIQGAYFTMATFLILPISLPLFMRPVKIHLEFERGSFVQSFREGLAYAIHTPTVRVVLIVAVTVITLAIPFLQLMPVYVTEVLDMGPGALGVIASVSGLLSIVGGLLAASLGDFRHKGPQLLLAVLSPCIAALILSQTSFLLAAIVATAIFGLLGSQYQPTTQTAVMKVTPPELRGRVNSILSFASGLGSVGVIFWGLAADAISLQSAYFLFGAGCLAMFLVYYTLSREFRELS